MASKNDSLAERLSRFRQIQLTVMGRKSGREITVPVWFVFEDGVLYLLPVRGTDTQWYKNVVKNPRIRVEARGTEAEVQSRPVRGETEIKSVVEKFRAKYGAGDVKKYYSKFDAAVAGKIA